MDHQSFQPLRQNVREIFSRRSVLLRQGKQNRVQGLLSPDAAHQDHRARANRQLAGRGLWPTTASCKCYFLKPPTDVLKVLVIL